MHIRTMTPDDWPEVFRIYKQGIDSGLTTFATNYPNYTDWNASHKEDCRFVAEDNGQITGFVAVSPVSSKPHYSGVVEVMVYVDESRHHQGIGTALLRKLVEQAPTCGYWCLYSSIFAANQGSIGLHNKCGFRTIGYRERIAKDRFGTWTDTVLMEYRFPDDE